MAQYLYDLFWTDSFWLPQGYTWQSLQRRSDPPPTVFKACLADLKYSFACALVLFTIRHLLDRLLYRPLGCWLGLTDPAVYQPRTQEDRRLEMAFQNGKRSGKSVDYQALSRSIDRSEVFVSNWFRVRRNRDRSSQLTKFTESAWQISFYSVSFLYGVAILWNKPYLWSTIEIWRGWPEHHVTSDVYWYYMVELGFYWTALVTVFSDTKRKDFKEMLLHHCITIVLMVFSWSLNFTRIGALILALHDAVDPLFHLAKIGSYTKLRWLSDPSFVTFMTVWFVTRLILYPFRIVLTALTELESECGISPALRGLQACLLVLQALHVIWSYFIVKVAFRVVFKGNRQDSRSDSEESTEECSETVKANGDSTVDSKAKST
ncbi:hypothetical protein BOX15_Mlig007874g2 [Macrostomum lignano]|uniref:TLC domain-containing protein n=1 Tax=Macrostomum lignano TaxID=282301 RepID=A0A267DGU1_9PLAT|nr:hypothetical protein BOX15_Mlig007874g3 [Macrostomum lignano]PAA48530.1 hypothetical protein BOX15_Mlig007874g2 [Macrostomum lignano]